MDQASLLDRFSNASENRSDRSGGMGIRDEILSYWDMCSREGLALQKGMYFRKPPAISIVLMSQRRGAPYSDSLSPDGRSLEYEGHDIKKEEGDDPKLVDQPWATRDGTPTDNAKFARSIDSGLRPLVRVYEKLLPGIWSDKGLFELASYTYTVSGARKAFRFGMKLSDQADDEGRVLGSEESRRLIPSWVKQTVFKRDRGQCVLCGAKDHLHFDHDLPFSKGGTGLSPENVRILCARHNLKKGARIE